MGEFDYIRWLRRQTPADPRVVVGPGDDAAVLRPARTPSLVTTDMLLDGSHFHLAEAGAYRVGRKAMAVNLSDIAAMAGRPIAAVVSVGLPRLSSPHTPCAESGSRHTECAVYSGGQALAEDLYRGLRDVADAFDTTIVGGDTNSWGGPLAVSVTLLGEATAKGPVLRSGARPGDWILVTGPLGGSILGKHLDFTPRVREALVLHAQADFYAMIDISDGLAADLTHLCAESGCGAVLRAEAIPIADAARQVGDGRTPLEHALGDGEDFELIVAVSPEDGQRLLDEQPIPGITLYHVGEFVREKEMYLESAGAREVLPPTGYVHRLE